MRTGALSLVLAAPLLGGCLSSAAGDQWRYEGLVWEHEPQIESASDARRMTEDLSSKSEITLHEAWNLALHRMETLALAGEELVRIQTLYEQAFAEALPRVAFRGSYLRQERLSTQSSFTLHERTEYSFNVRQPIFNGLREYYAIRQGASLTRAAQDDVRFARLSLYADAAEAFYAVLELERELATTQDTLRLAQERRDELSARNRLGIARRTELLQQEAEVAATQALIDNLSGRVAVAWETLRFVTGLPAPVRLVDTLEAPADLGPVARYLDRASIERTDLRSLREQIRAAEEGVGVARAGWLPSITLDGSYYTHREGTSGDINWDVVIAGEVPIFDGFATQARVREADSFVRSAKLRLSERQRTIILGINRAHTAVRTFQTEIVSLEKAVASAQENYDLVQGEYRLGIVTNVEVLTSFDTLQQAKLALDRARYQLKIALVALDVESGVVPGGAK